MDYFRNFSLLVAILCFGASFATDEVSMSGVFMFLSTKGQGYLVVMRFAFCAEYFEGVTILRVLVSG